MAIAALALYGAWFVLAFGLRMLVQLRRTGDSGFRGLSARPGSLEWCAGIGFAVALAVGVAAPIADLAGLRPLGPLDHGPVRGTGLVLAAAGIGLTLLAQLSMGDAWRIGVDRQERTELVHDGAFAIVRNPIYSAMVVTAVGLAAMVPNALAILGLIALAAALEIQVRGVEEPYLRSVHGTTYDDYAARVGRFVPGLGRRPVDSPQSETQY